MLTYSHVGMFHQEAQNARDVTYDDIVKKYGESWYTVNWDNTKAFNTPNKRRKTPKKENPVAEDTVDPVDQMIKDSKKMFAQMCDTILEQAEEIRSLKQELGMGGGASSEELKEIKKKLAALAE